MRQRRNKNFGFSIFDFGLNLKSKIQNPKSKIIIALGSGILMGLTVAPVGAWFLAWVALLPLWVLVVNHAQGKNSSPPLPLLALIWGIGYHGIALSWITGVHPMTWMGVPWLASLGIALFCWVFITLWGAALVTAWATGLFWILNFGFWISQKSRVKSQISSLPRLKPGAIPPLIRVLIGTALWCGLEALWSAGPLWWSSLSYTQSPHNLVILHLGQLSGPSAVTAAIVAVNGLIAEAFINRRDTEVSERISSVSRQSLQRDATPLNGGNLRTGVAWEPDASPLKSGNPPTRLAPQRAGSSTSLWFINKYLVIATTLLITLHIIGFALYTRPLAQSPGTALKVGIVQGNIPNQIKLYREGFLRAIEGYTTGYLTLAARGVDAVLTPEGALPFRERYIKESTLFTAVQGQGVVAWIGGFADHGSSYGNSLFTITSDGIFSRYDKVKMVPIGEYVPFEQILGGIVKRLSPLQERQIAGSPKQVFNTPFGRAIVVICYGSAFPELFRYQAAAGGQFILSPSNDAHFSEPMPAQHHAQDIMRAIETDRWGIRATNTGYSAFVDPHGRTLWISGHNTYEVHAETIYRRQTQTLYVRWGDWLTPLLLVSAGGVWLLTKIGSRE